MNDPHINSEKIIAETERLIIREMISSDLDALCKIMCDEEAMRPAYVRAFHRDEVAAWLNRHIARYRSIGIGLWAVVLRENGEMIGQCGLTYQQWRDSDILEIGYLFQRVFWHQGYATEAASACKEYAFSVMNENAVYSIIRDSNISAQNVALRIGMHRVDQRMKEFRNTDMSFILYGVVRQ